STIFSSLIKRASPRSQKTKALTFNSLSTSVMKRPENKTQETPGNFIRIAHIYGQCCSLPFVLTADQETPAAKKEESASP
ncbi:MAG: hypothetical protein ACYDAA_18000, partial [Syntrophales bacterium]